jgi:hypothetical protein
MTIPLCSARLGVLRHIGVLRTPEGRPGIEIVVIDHKVVVHIWRHAADERGRTVSEKFYTIELPAGSAAQCAELLHQASVCAARSAGSPTQAPMKPTVLGR